MKKRLLVMVLMVFLSSCGRLEVEEEPESQSIKLTEAFGGLTFERPLYITFLEEVAYVVLQKGQIYSIKDNQAILFLDISDRVYSKGNEQGLLGFAFDLDYLNNQRVFVNYTTQSETNISAFVEGQETILLTYEQPYSNHNGGHLDFGPDGYLYIASGDGGSSGDPHNHAQNSESLLGKILRVDVSQDQLKIPDDNPFGNEVYALGLRNPWRFSFDSKGDLYVGDVGQNKVEEINIIEMGKNYGWNVMEGTIPYSGDVNDAFERPIYEYSHQVGQSITGGYVYEGEKFEFLKGSYVYGDFVSGTIWALKEGQNSILLETNINIASFGKDEAGELYVVDLNGKIYTFEKD
ncbi:MAG: PQQ-dependent sugar dehydrogenase [Erysipelothrix sp.]|nr:PQQ-dependent sugar dehydrogenase [Erysipelothrix sp.]